MKYCDQCTNQSYADEISIPLNEKVIFFFFFNFVDEDC